MGPPKSRFQRRLLHHILIGGIGLGLTLLFMHLFPTRDFMSRVSIGTAYAGLFLTATVLLLGPFKVLWRRPNPVSFDLRRDMGIWAGILAVVHTAVGLNVHLRGKMWLYFLDAHHHLRRDLFGFGNYTGALAALIFAMLLALSNDLSLRWLKARRWKSLQQCTYAAVVLTAAHAIAYQQTEKRTLPFEAVLYVTLVIVSVIQLLGILKTRRTPESPTPSVRQSASG